MIIVHVRYCNLMPLPIPSFFTFLNSLSVIHINNPEISNKSGEYLTLYPVNNTDLNQSYWWRWCGHIWSRSWLRGPGARQRLRAAFSPWWRTASTASEARWDDPAQTAPCPPLWPGAEGQRQQSPSCWSRRRPARQTQLRSEKFYFGEKQ